MKLARKIIFIIVLILTSIGLIIVGKGYDMYKQALNEAPLTQKVKSIKEKDNYTNIEEIPKIYKDAVIAVEDHRFYKHNGIDIIAIGRAFINDIKAMDFVEGGSTITRTVI